MPRILVSLTLISLLATAGCSSLRFPGVYRIDIPQGNFVTEDMLSELQPGMSPEQVRYVLGAPTLVDPFTRPVALPDDLPARQGRHVSQNIAVYFENGTYSRYEGEVIDDFKAKTSGRNDLELQRKAADRKDDAE